MATFAVAETNKMQHIIKERIKELRAWAKENIAGKEVYHNELGSTVHFTNNGIKEYLNQPHKYYFEKNQMIKDIQRIIESSEYKGSTIHKNRISHIFEIEINKDKSWIIANENDEKKIQFYSISDNEKVLTGVKK